jgi:DUF1365 family protein
MNSGLYECTILHRRLQPKRHEFVYRMFLFHLNIDELSGIAERIPFFSVGEPNLYSLREEDYFQFHSRGLRANVETFLQAQNFPSIPVGIHLLTLPRLLGYTFNPISVFFCYDADARPLVAVIQVGNTFGELKPYLVPPTPDGTGFHIRVAKDYYVSPFSAPDLAFDFHFQNPGRHLRIRIDEYQGDERILISSLTGSREELTAGHLARLTLRFPLVTLKVIFLIHFEALRLWLKGIPFRRKEADPERQKTAFRAR